MLNKLIRLIVIVCFNVLIIWCLFVTFKSPYLGIVVELNQNQEWIISNLDEMGINGLAGLQVGDQILQIDGQEPEQFIMVKSRNIIENATELMISREEQVKYIDLNLKQSLIRADFLYIFIGLLCLFLGRFLYVRMSSSPSAKLLSYVFIVGGTIWFSMGASIRGDFIGKYVIAAMMTLLPVVFYHFLVVFFKEKGNVQFPYGVLKYMYAIVLLGMFIRIDILFPQWTANINQYNGNVTLSFFVVVFLINIILLCYLFIKHYHEKTHLSTIIRTVWFSALVSFLPMITLSFIPQIILGYEFVHSMYTSFFALCFPITFAYLIATDQLYDIGIVLRRLMFSFMLSIIPCSIFIGLFAIIFPEDATMKHLVFLLLSSTLLMTFVLYSTEYLTTLFGKFVFPKKYILQYALKNISKNLEKISSFRELKDIILGDIVRTFEVNGAAIIFKYNTISNIEIISEGHINTDEVKLLIESNTPNNTMYNIIEINQHEEYQSYLILTRKNTNTLLSREEMQWLKLITTYLAVSLENLHLIRKLRMSLQQMASQLPNEHQAQDIQWFRKLMFELQEEERMRIAMDLHDTTMQDLFFLKRRLAGLLETHMRRAEDKEQLNNLMNYIELINTNLRQSCFELNPYLLKETGLIHTVQKLIDKEAYHSPFTITFDVDPTARNIESKDLESKKHIFRIIQELINNAKKHSQATFVKLSMRAPDNIFSLIYEDNGIGFENEIAATTEIRSSGIGMEQMRGRVLYLNGHLDLTSMIGGGVRYEITLPIN